MLKMLQVLVLLLGVAGVYCGDQCVCVRNRRGALNVRAGPSGSYSVVGTAYPDNCMYYTSTTSGWHKVKYNGRNAYVSGSYTSAPQDCGTPSNGRCLQKLCSSFSSPTPRGCDTYGCGHNGAPRGSRRHAGVDVRCTMNDVVYAPYDGELVRVARPYGSGTCCDTGFLFKITEFSGNYEVKGFYARPTVRPGTRLRRGDVLATHAGLLCGCYGNGMRDHVHLDFYKNGVKIDPTSFAYCQFY